MEQFLIANGVAPKEQIILDSVENLVKQALTETADPFNPLPIQPKRKLVERLTENSDIYKTNLADLLAVDYTSRIVRVKNDFAPLEAEFFDVYRPDLRNALLKELNIVKRIPKDLIGGAKLLTLMDCSGSMGIFEKEMAKIITYWKTVIMSSRYYNITKRFIQHTTVASEVTNAEDFWEKDASGGTICSGAFKLANEMIVKDYQDRNHIYINYFTDGDNLTSDNERLHDRIKALLHDVNQINVIEINRHSTVAQALKGIKSTNFNYVTVTGKQDVLKALKAMGDNNA